MHDRARNLVVGLTALAGAAGGLFLLLLFGYLPAWLEGGYKVRVQLSNASGLTDGSRVRLSGIDVGRVIVVNLQQPPHRGVDVVALLRDDIRVPAAVRVRAESPLLGGSPSLAFEVEHLTPQQVSQWLPTDGTAVIRGEALTLVSQFAGEMEAAIREPTQRFNQIARQFESLSQQWTLVGENLNRLVEQRSLQRVDNGQESGNVATMVARADQRLSELKAVIGGLDGLLNDAQLRDDITVTVGNARRLTQRVNDTLSHVEKRYVALADDLSGVIGSVRVVFDKARAGQGTLGKFFHDPALYENLNDAVQRLQTALDEFHLLVQKWKAEGLPVQF